MFFIFRLIQVGAHGLQRGDALIRAEHRAALGFAVHGGMDGEHGHGKWMMYQSLPPYMYVERDIESGFGSRLDKIINNRIDQILRK